jgi:hypothetical protein
MVITSSSEVGAAYKFKKKKKKKISVWISNLKEILDSLLGSTVVKLRVRKSV